VAVTAWNRHGSREQVAAAAWDKLRQPYEGEVDDALSAWVSSIPSISKKRTTKPATCSEIPIQYQWVYSHPSQSGWLSEGGFAEYFIEMGVPFILGLFQEDGRRSPIGDLLALLHGGLGTAKEATRIANPLLLSPQERVLFLFTLLQTDGDFLIPLVHVLRNRYPDTPFNYVQAGAQLPDVIGRILQVFAGSLNTSADREQYRKLQRAKLKIQENIAQAVESQGFGSRREQTSIPRLEWLVDLGILIKHNDQKYTYSFHPRGHSLVDDLHAHYEQCLNATYREKAVERLVDNNFAQIAKMFLGRSPMTLRAPESVVDFILPAYKHLRGSTGYCLVRPLILFANLLHWMEGGDQGLEYLDAIAALEKEYEDDPTRFYMTTARFGEDKQLTFDAA
jgi:hypothetical protein